MILAIDPGNTESGYVIMGSWPENQIIHFSGVLPNEDMLKRIDEFARSCNERGVFAHVACEMMYPRGMPMSGESMETLVWIGRFVERCEDGWNTPLQRVNRHKVKLHLCGAANAKDPNVRQALLDRVGRQGTKRDPGPTYGIKSHAWAALGVAVYALDHPQEPRT